MFTLTSVTLMVLVGAGQGPEVGEAPPPTTDPATQAAIDDGNVARCNNGTFSDNTDFRATCSSNDGVDAWLAPYGRCGDGHVIAMSEDATCDDHDGFDALLPPSYVPQPEQGDVALCANGTYSANTDFGATCSSSGGVDIWLAPYGECGDGEIVVMGPDADCDNHGGFARLLPADFTPPTAVVATSAAPGIPTTIVGTDEVLGIGDTDTTGAFQFTVHAFEDPVVETDGLIAPADGSRYVAVEVTITNTSAAVETFSTLLGAELIDSMNQSWDVSLFATSNRPSIDGDVPPGDSRRGWIAFEVPADSIGFRLRLTGNLTAEGTTFTVS